MGNNGYRKLIAHIQTLLLSTSPNRDNQKGRAYKIQKKINCRASGHESVQDRLDAVALPLCHTRPCHDCFESGCILGVGLCGPGLLAFYR